MKKYLYSLLVIMLCVSLTVGCNKSKSEDKTTTNGKTEESNNNNNGNNNVEVKDANIEKTVIMDKNNIKVTAEYLGYGGLFGPEIVLYIENGSNEDIILQVDDFTVNGLVVDTFFSANVSAGSSLNESITLLSDSLELSNITTISEIEFELDVLDNDYDIVTSEHGIVLETNAKDYVQDYSIDGKLIVDNKGVKIYVLNQEPFDDYFGKNIVFYIDNNSGRNIVVETVDTKINGYDFTSLFMCFIPSNKKGFQTFTIYDFDLEEFNINNLEKLSLKFDVYDKDTWSDVFVSDEIIYEF